MYPVTHMAIAAGGVWAGAGLWRRSACPASNAGSAARTIDYRIVALGALIPDAIDKPLWHLTGHDIGSDHTIGHTLLFSFAIIAAGILLARRGEARLLWLGLGCLSHPLVDPVVAHPNTLLWPLLGWRFQPSPGIPSSYLRAIDGVLVVAGAAAWWSALGGFRERASRFLRAGAL